MLARRQITKQFNIPRRITTTKASTKMFSRIELHVKPEMNLLQNKQLIYTLGGNIVKPQASKLIIMQAEVLNENKLKLLPVQNNAANWKFENSNFHIIVPNNKILKIMPYPLKNVRLRGGNDNRPIHPCCNDPNCPRVMLYNQRIQKNRLDQQAMQEAQAQEQQAKKAKTNKESKVKEEAVKEKKKSKKICSCFVSNNSDYETKKKEPNIEQLEKEIQQMRMQIYELKNAIFECACIETIQYDEYYTETADNVNTEARPLTLQDKECQCRCILESNQELCSATPSTTGAERMIINDIKPSKTRKGKIEQCVSCESIGEQVENLKYFITPKRRSTQTQNKGSPMKSNSCLTMETTTWTTPAQTKLAATKSDECMNFVCELEEIKEEPNYGKVVKETVNGREFKVRRRDENSNMKREILHRRKESLDKPGTSRKVARVSDASNDLEAIQQRRNTKTQQDAVKERDALTRKEIRNSLEMTRRNSHRKSGDIALNGFEWKHRPNEHIDYAQQLHDDYNNCTKSDECMNFVCEVEEIEVKSNYSKVSEETANGREFKGERHDETSNMIKKIVDKPSESLDIPGIRKYFRGISDSSHDMEAIQQRRNSKNQQDVVEERDALTHDSLEMSQRNSHRKSGDSALNSFEWKQISNEQRLADFDYAQQLQIDDYNNCSKSDECLNFVCEVEEDFNYSKVSEETANGRDFKARRRDETENMKKEILDRPNQFLDNPGTSKNVVRANDASNNTGEIQQSRNTKNQQEVAKEKNSLTRKELPDCLEMTRRDSQRNSGNSALSSLDGKHIPNDHRHADFDYAQQTQFDDYNNRTTSDECMNFVCEVEEIEEEPNYSKVSEETANGREFKAEGHDETSNMQKDILDRPNESLDKPDTSKNAAGVSNASNDMQEMQQRRNNKTHQDAVKERDALTRKEIRDSLEMTRRYSHRKSGDIALNSFDRKHIPYEQSQADFNYAQQPQFDYNKWTNGNFAQTVTNIGKSPTYVVKISKGKKNEGKKMNCCCGCCCKCSTCCKPEKRSSSECKPPRRYIQICKGCKQAQTHQASCLASSNEYYISWNGKKRNVLQATKASSSYVFKCFETDARFWKNNAYNKGMNKNFACFHAADSTPACCEHETDEF